MIASRVLRAAYTPLLIGLPARIDGEQLVVLGLVHVAASGPR